MSMALCYKMHEDEMMLERPDFLGHLQLIFHDQNSSKDIILQEFGVMLL